MFGAWSQMNDFVIIWQFFKCKKNITWVGGGGFPSFFTEVVNQEKKIKKKG